MKKFLIRTVISLGIGALMLWLAAREISFDGVWGALKAANWLYVLPYLGLMAVQHIFRAWRWGFLLAPVQPVPFSRILPISSVGFFAILALPLRMGEFVRPYLIADPPKLRMSHGLGTMAVERVFDGLILALGAWVAVAIAETRTTVPEWVEAAGFIALVVFLTALVVLVMTLWQRERAVLICRRLVGIISPKLAERAAGIARGVVEGFRVLPDWRRLLPFLFGTAAYWVGNAAAIWVLAKGFDLNMTFGAATAFIALVGIGIMIPAGPGFVGNYEFFAKGAMGLYIQKHVSESVAAAFIVTSHATNALWYIGAGLVAMLSPEITFKKVWTVSTSSEQLDDVSPSGEQPTQTSAPPPPSTGTPAANTDA
ncbi:MAG: flippase-like domain-containing protein [Myxococcales bacterium]|nr:flippase-like domain-containing protein [Myxococcales bacterium]